MNKGRKATSAPSLPPPSYTVETGTGFIDHSSSGDAMPGGKVAKKKKNSGKLTLSSLSLSSPLALPSLILPYLALCTHTLSYICLLSYHLLPYHLTISSLTISFHTLSSLRRKRASDVCGRSSESEPDQERYWLQFPG